MPTHDAYARITPHELVFRTREEALAFVAAVDEEAEGRGTDPGEPEVFVTMGAVDAFVRERAAGDPSPEALLRHGALAFHGYHFAREEWPLYLVSVEAARGIVERTPGGSPAPPTSAGYLQLPQHLFWTEVVGEGPESVDGVHWTLGPRGMLHALIVTGVRSEASGVGVVPLPEAPAEHAAEWLELDARGDGSDFTTTMPGAELERLHGLETSGEVLKLLARTFAFIGSIRATGGEKGAEEGPGIGAGTWTGSDVAATDAAEQPARAVSPTPSALAFTRVAPFG